MDIYVGVNLLQYLKRVLLFYQHKHILEVKNNLIILLKKVYSQNDVIVHSGDFCDKGTVEEVEDFVEWFAALPHKHKIFVAGNHDDCLYGATIEGLPEGVHYLCHSGIEIDGVRFYGMPMFVVDELSGEYEKAISRIPSDTDVLITHQPPYGILDVTDGVHYGNISLLGRVLSIKPRLHLFGHVHKANGKVEAHDTLYVNGSIVSGMKILYKPQLLIVD